MDFELTEEQKMLKTSLRDMITKEFPKEYFRKLHAEERWPFEVLDKLGTMGYLSLAVPVEYGGSGGSSLDVALVQEELARCMGGSAMAYLLSTCFGERTLLAQGNEEQKRKYLPGLMSGKLITSLCLTEPGGGTDILAMKSKAIPDGKGNYIINGQKTFISGAHVADLLVVVVRTNQYPGKKALGITSFLLEPKTEGIEIKRLRIGASQATGANDVFFTDVKVPEENILGEVDRGFYQMFTTLNNERIGAAAICVGIAQAAFDDALNYAKQRQAFGRPIGQFQAIQHKLVDCYARIEAARYLLYKAAWLETNNLPCAVESTLAKLVASESAVWVTNQCMDVLGGYQFSLDYDMIYYFLNSRYTFAPISNEMARNFIGEQLGLPKSY